MVRFLSRSSAVWKALLIALLAAVAVGGLPLYDLAFGYPEFIGDAVAPAQTSQRETGVPASVTIAQAIKESEWGDKHIGDAYNYFGIKAFELADGSIYVGPVAEGWVWAKTTEYVDGQPVTVDARFRDYANMADSFTDHGYFFWENERYHTAFDYEDDPREFARQIAAAGYATDPNYASSLIALMEQYNLFQYDVPGEAPPDEDVPGILVDDLSDRAERGGAEQPWHELGVGYRRHSYWTYVAQSAETQWMRWTPAVKERGSYEVLVYVPPLRASTGKARYVIQHAGSQDTVEISQKDHLKEWVSLGEFIFAAEGEETIRLSDHTGEPQASATIAFDAIRLVSAGQAPLEFDAQLAGSPDIVIAYVGEEAQLQIEASNTGLEAWRMNVVVLSNVKRPLGAETTQLLPANTPPGQTATWKLQVRAPDKAGVYKSDWQLKRADGAFGSTLSAYLVVLPEGASELEKEIRAKIEEWRQQAEQEIDDLITEITALILKEVGNFFQRLIDDTCGKLCGASALIVFGTLLLWWRRS